MHVQDLVGISGFTRVLLVCSCQQGAHPRGRPTPLAPFSKLQINEIQRRQNCIGRYEFSTLFTYQSSESNELPIERQRAQNHKEGNLKVCIDAIQYHCHRNWLIHTGIYFQYPPSFVIFETLIANRLNNHSFIHIIITIKQRESRGRGRSGIEV